MRLTLLLICCLAAWTVVLLGAPAAAGIYIDRDWVPFGATMTVGRAHSAVLFANASLFAVGGCENPVCTEALNTVEIIDPNQQRPTKLVELPIFLNAGNLGDGAAFTPVPMRVAGPTAMVRVDDVDAERGEGFSFYVVGPCGYYFPKHQNPLDSTLVRQQYTGIWHLSSSLTRVLDHFSIPRRFGGKETGGTSAAKPIPFRANATCSSRGHLIFIIGGVDIITGEALATADVYDTRSRRYTPEAARLDAAVQNPLVAMDSELMYVAGGETRFDVPSEEANVKRGCVGATQETQRSLSYCSRHSATVWHPSVKVQAIMVGSVFDRDGASPGANASLPTLVVRSLPANLELRYPNADGGNPFLSSNRYLFAFNGKLCLILNVSFVNCLDMEELLNCVGLPTNGSNALMWHSLLGTSSTPPVSASAPFAFPLSAGVLGTMLAFFALGGFGADGEASARVFYRGSGLHTASVAKLDAVVPINTPLRLTLHPPIDGYARLSSNPLCIGNAAGTSDVRVFRLPEDATVAEFQPRAESDHVYVCFSNGPVWLPSAAGTDPGLLDRNGFLFTPIMFTQFQIRALPDPFHPANRKGQSLSTLGISFSVMLGIAVVTIAVFVFGRFRQPPSCNGDYAMRLLLGESSSDETEDEGPAPVSVVVRGGEGNGGASTTSNNAVAAAVAVNEPPTTPPTRPNPKSERDSLVKNTTQWSRYEVLQRIGEGAFSSVYLVKRKSTGQLFALKYLVCKDNKERLDAIGECETINSLQGHPNIIRLVDMFMNYEFDGGHLRSSPEAASVLTPPAPAAVAAPPSPPQQRNAAGINRAAHTPRVVMTLAGGQPPTPLREPKPQEVPHLQPPSSVGHVFANAPPRLTASSIQGAKNPSAARKQALSSAEDGQASPPANAASWTRHSPKWDRDDADVDAGALARAQAELPAGAPPRPPPPPPPPPAPATSTAVAGCANSRSPQEPSGGGGAPRCPGPQSPSGHVLPTSPAGMPPHPLGKVVHYSNFAQVSYAGAPPPAPTTPQGGLSVPQKRTSYAPSGGIHYTDFDIALAETGNFPATVRLPVNNNGVAATQTAKHAPLRYVQPAVGTMQYKNFISPASGTNDAANKLAPMTKPRSVADAVRAARIARMSESAIDSAAPGAPPNPTAVIHNNGLVTTTSPAAPTPPVLLPQPQPTRDAAANTICPPSNVATAAVRLNEEPLKAQHPRQQHQEQQQQQQQQQREEGKALPLRSATNKSPTPVAKPPLAVAQVMARLTTPGTPEVGPVHTRYLCLVMEYHPMGDLCGYVLRHSAKHNAKLKRQLDEEWARFIKAQEEDAKKAMDHLTTSAWVRVGSESDDTPSFFRPGKTSQSYSHDTQCQSSHDRANEASGPATAGSLSYSNVDLALGSGSHSSLGRETEAEFAMRGNALTEPQLLSIAYQLASVLQYLHAQRPPIVHRDLKPENILISRKLPQDAAEKPNDGDAYVGEKLHSSEADNDDDGKSGAGGAPLRKKSHFSLCYGPGCSVKLSEDIIPIVVTDFGLAFMLEDRRRAGRGGGTRPYIAPECWSGQTTTASDIWSLGCLLYALATARVTVQTVRIMYEEAKKEGFAAMILNDILAENYSMAFACFVVSLLGVNHSKRPSAEVAMRCFMLEDGVVRFNPNCPFFSNVRDL
ncbi:putative protein kinase [Trypanosoma conorhini]|uniref:non-specific serine/threonine protein kinase n=1 Tax=Trypanosoma conorhini TaxID=83891 RepID=A0A3R7LM98_9TRYP|nr:putative protein kinase [Trypanosoma conorhini]RNF27451.1 putative protein kinase [Trypanosoma conorhini]